MTAAQIVNSDLEALYIGNLNTVEADLVLPGKGANGSDLAWMTSDSRFIDENGKVGRPLFGMGHRKVWLTCTASFEGASAQRVFEATVLQKKRENRIVKVLPVSLRVYPGEVPPLPSVVIAYCDDGRKITLPVCWAAPEVSADGKKQFYAGKIEDTDIPACAGVIFDENAPKQGFGAEPVPELTYLPVSAVRLLPGTEYYRAQERMNAYLLSVDDDSMLRAFRTACGLPDRGAAPLTGWDAPECNLKGHTTGHYLSGLSLAYAATGDKRFSDKLDYLIRSLTECRDAFARSGKTRPGFLSAYDESQFDLLEKFTKYPEIWAPYYTFEKIMSGLYDACTLAGKKEALPLLTGMGDWAHERLSRLTEEHRQKMWAMYIAGEFGGMIGILAKLGRLTGNKKYLETAEYFKNDKLFYPMGENEDTLEDMHANQHIPQIMGIMDLYAAGGNAEYLKTARNFRRFATEHHAYCIGGVGETEMFHAPDSETRYLTDKPAESCPSYNLLRLTGQVAAFEPRKEYWDYYENTLLNHILTSAAKCADGGTTYFLPLCPGGQKEYSTAENTCCHGTGMESRYRYMEHILSLDENAVYVNLFADSEAVLPDGKRVILRTCFDTGENARGSITVSLPDGLEKSLRIRRADWMKEPQGCFEAEGPLSAGSVFTVSFKMETEIRPASDPRYSFITCGPFIMAHENSAKEFLLAAQAKKNLIRLNETDLKPYHVYFKTGEK